MNDRRRDLLDQQYLRDEGELPPSRKEQTKRRLYRRIEALPEDVADIAAILKGIVDAL